MFHFDVPVELTITKGKSFFDIEQSSPLKFGMSHSPVLKSKKSVNVAASAKSFKLIF